MNRRSFFRGVISLGGTTLVPRTLLWAGNNQLRERRRLVVIFQRGALDGLSAVVPYREKNYYALRPTIAVPPQKVLDLDGFFGLHPSLSSFLPLYRERNLAVVQAVGSPDVTRSHFDAQEFMESGTPGIKGTPDGWLNRALQSEDKTAHPPP